MKSILHEEDGTCYLCRRLYNYWGRYRYTEEHHVFEGTANRRLSEKYGLKVYLCLFHHREGPEAVHQNARNAERIKMDAQEAFERTHTREEFVNIFGRNWLDEDPWEEPWISQEEEDTAGGFRFLDGQEGLEGIGEPFLEIEKAAAVRDLNDRQFRNLLEILEVMGE